MLEAPTIVIRINNELINMQRENLSYSNNEDLFSSLFLELINYVGNDNVDKPKVSYDEAGIVSYYSLCRDVSLPIINTNGTELGNDRVPNNDCNVQIPYMIRLVRRNNEYA